MTAVAVFLALLAASLHAVWSLLSKRLSRYDPVCFVWLASLGSFVVYAPLVVVMTNGLRLSVSAVQTGFMAGSIVINLVYFLVTQYGYRLGDLSVVYPIARGTGPVLAATGGILLLGEVPTATGLLGLCAVVIGVVALGWRGGGAGSLDALRSNRVVGYALLSGTTIACYTLWDQHAVGPLAISPLLLNWVDDAGRVLLLAPTACRRQVALKELWTECRLLLVGAATLMPLPYILFLFSLRLAPASVVSPVREVSVLLVVIASRTFLAETGLRFRLMTSSTVLIGLILLATGY